MMIVERAAVEATDLPLDALAARMRLSDGWAAVPGQLARLEARLRAALDGVEARTGKALVLRSFTLEGPAAERVSLPLAPCVSVEALSVDGTAVAAYGVERDLHRTVLVLPRYAGRLRVEMRAGFASWDAVPGALSEAVLIYAEALDAGATALPDGVAALIAPHRPVRVGAGA